MAKHIGRFWKPLGVASIVVGVLVAGCQKYDKPDDPIPGNFSYSYTLMSNTNKMPATSRVVVVSAPTSAYCGNQGTPVQEYNQLVGGGGNTLTITYGPVHRTTYFVISTYIDVNADNVLSNGDFVWGTNSVGISGDCIRPTGDATDNTNKVWEDVGTTLFGGTATYTGTTLTF